jgi:hypothetical protein
MYKKVPLRMTKQNTFLYRSDADDISDASDATEIKSLPESGSPSRKSASLERREEEEDVERSAAGQESVSEERLRLHEPRSTGTTARGVEWRHGSLRNLTELEGSERAGGVKPPEVETRPADNYLRGEDRPKLRKEHSTSIADEISRRHPERGNGRSEGVTLRGEVVRQGFLVNRGEEGLESQRELQRREVENRFRGTGGGGGRTEVLARSENGRMEERRDGLELMGRENVASGRIPAGKQSTNSQDS